MTVMFITGWCDFLGYKRWNAKAWSFSILIASLTVYHGDLVTDNSIVKALVEGER